MAITYDPNKRDAALANRGLDFEDAEALFAGSYFETEDVRNDYGEPRMICFGMLRDRMVAVGYTPRGADRHVSRDPLHNSSRPVMARNRAVCGVEFLANSGAHFSRDGCKIRLASHPDPCPTTSQRVMQSVPCIRKANDRKQKRIGPLLGL